MQYHSQLDTDTGPGARRQPLVFNLSERGRLDQTRRPHTEHVIEAI